MDWSDLKADQSLQMLRASLPAGGRALTIYEEVHLQKKLANRTVRHRFLQRRWQLLPRGAAPIIVASGEETAGRGKSGGWRWGGPAGGMFVAALGGGDERGERRREQLPSACQILNPRGIGPQAVMAGAVKSRYALQCITGFRRSRSCARNSMRPTPSSRAQICAWC
jgi:hypothetical protein